MITTQGQSFTALNVKSRVRYFCTNNPNTIIGSMTIVADALLPPQSTDTAPIKPKIVTGNVLVLTFVNTTENRNSFHEKSMQSTVVAASPGAASGSTIRQNAPHREQPSIRAASSSSTIISLKNPYIIQITNGRLKVVWAMMTAM